MQTTGGYIDLIFNKFEIRKLIGEIEIPKKISNILTSNSIYDRYKNKNLNMIKDLAENGNSIDRIYIIQWW
jgi:hypothetical protein